MKNKIGRYIGQRMMWISLICIAPAFPVRAEQAPEAMIRETGVSYETVEEALEDAQTAQTVVLTEDAQISGQVRVREGVTLVLPAEGEGYVGQYNPSNQESTSTPVLEHTLTIPADASLEVNTFGKCSDRPSERIGYQRGRDIRRIFQDSFGWNHYRE